MTPPTVIPQFVHEAAALFPSACFGLDISKWQPDINPAQVQVDGVRFVILKATQGVSLDPRFLAHRKAMHAGAPLVKLGAYHLCNCVNGLDWSKYFPNDAKSQGQFAGDIAKAHPINGGHWLDLEPDSSSAPKPRFFSALAKLGKKLAADWIRTWLDAAEQRAGERFGLYLSPRLAKEGGMELLRVVEDRPLWFAFYQKEPRLPRTATPGTPEGWDRWDLWQYKADDNKETKDIDESGRCRGVMGGKKACDLNVANPASLTYSKYMGA